MAAKLSIGDGASRRDVKGVFIGDGATLRTVKAVFIGDAGVVRQVFSAYAPITAVTISGNPNAGWGTTTSLTAGSDGSSASKSYAWTKLSGSANVNITGSTTSATATFDDNSATGSYTQHAATFRCTVSDGTSSAYADVTVTFTGTI